MNVPDPHASQALPTAEPETSGSPAGAALAPDVLAEIRAVREGAGLIDLTSCGVVRLAGSDAASVLNGVLSNDTRLAPGQGCYACLLNDVGRVRTALHVLQAEAEILLLTQPGLGETVVEAVDYYIFTEDAVVADASSELALIALQGPAAARLLAEVASQQLAEPAAQLLSGAAAELSHAQLVVGGADVRAVLHSRTGEPGYDLLVARAQVAQVIEALLAVGAVRVGADALEVLRVEAGIPRCGAELTEQVNPLEAGILGALSFDKGCYLGQETIARITFLSRPVRRLVALLSEEGAALPVGARVFLDTKDVGWITTSICSPALGRAISMGYVRTDTLAKAPLLRVVAGDASWLARASELPLYRSACLEALPRDAVAPPLEVGHKPQLPF